jgi:PAS domain S-box-containing protein
MSVPKTQGQRSLRTTLTLTILGLSLAVLLIAAGLQAYSNYQIQREVIASQQQLIAEDAASAVRGFIEKKFSLLEATASFGNLTSAETEEQNLALRRLLRLDPAFRQVILLNAQEKELTRVSRMSKPLSARSIEYDKSGLLSAVTRAERHVGSVYVDRTTSEPMVVLAVAVTDVFGDFQGALVAEVNLKFMWDLVDRMRIGKRGLAYVVNKQGDLLAIGDISRVLRGENLRHIEEVDEFVKGDELTHRSTADISTGIRGNRVVANHAHLGRPDWAIVVELPVMEAYEPVIHELEISALIIVLTAVFAILIGTRLSRKITEPVIALRDAMRSTGRDGFGAKIEVESANEIGELADSFNQMIEDLNRTTVSRDSLVKEVAERKQAENALRESETRFRGIFENATDGILLTDIESKRFSLANQALCNMLGYGMDEVANLGVGDIHAEADLPHVMEQFERLARGEIGLTHDIPVKRKDGSVFYADISASVVTMGNRRYLLGILRDLTEHRKMEEAKRNLEAQNMVVEELTELDCVRREFVETITHELRTPMTPLRSVLEMFADGTLGEVTANQGEYIEMMKRNVERLVRFTTDVLTFSKLESGNYRIHLEQLSLLSVAAPVVALLGKKAEEKNSAVSLEVQTDMPVYGDSGALSDVLTNLINNAIVHNAEGTCVSVGAEMTGRDSVQVSVSDNGKGIDPKVMDRMFQKFVRAGVEYGPGYRGSGLGLSICKGLVGAMGGKIRVESIPGQGTTFLFTLPAHPPG